MSQQLDQIVLVAFDVRAATHEAAARLVHDRLASLPVVDRGSSAWGVESWFLPDPEDKHIDGNDRMAIRWETVPLDDCTVTGHDALGRPIYVLPEHAPREPEQEPQHAPEPTAAPPATMSAAEARAVLAECEAERLADDARDLMPGERTQRAYERSQRKRAAVRAL